MGDQHNSVSVFHFTDRISSAKLKKYTESTSRGMAHTRKLADIGGLTASTEPRTKKPRLKLNGPRRKSDEGGDTITVSRPRRLKDQNIRFKYSDDMVMTTASLIAPTNIESPKLAVSPAPSSGLSSLEPTPQSEKETSPFVDPEPSGRQDYGDFLSYYIAGGDEEPEPISKPNAAVEVNTKPSSKPRKSTPKPKPSKAAAKAPHPPTAPNPAQYIQGQSSHPPQVRPPQQIQVSPPLHNHAPPPQQFPLQPPPNVSRPQHSPPAHLRGPPQNRPAVQGPPRPTANPQPIVQFNEIVHDPPPDTPDTVATMIKKLRELSFALTTFGGVPPAPPLSPSRSLTPVKAAPDSAANPLDNFLSFFDGDGDEEVYAVDCGLKDPGTLDGPLTHGIIFIQNALKSWAQQRVSQMYMQQYRQQLHSQQQSNAKRGPGRPRKFDEPTNLLPPSPVIQMDLASTPEGSAIKAFQAVLYSECLRVNVRLPASLACALRQLYMQIDLLINQGEREPQSDWQCMSYSAQISAHKTRVDRWKEHQAKVHEETQRQQSLALHSMMAQMGLPPQQHYPMTAAQAEHAHAIELETRRAQAHAHQQPYIRQQHLNPLQLGIHPSGPPAGFVPSQPGFNGMRPASAGPHHGRGESMVQMVQHSSAPMPPASTSSPGVQLDKMKLYVPGYLPRSGQNMKFSFSPQSSAAQIFGANTFPSTEHPGPGMVQRVPMSAPPPHTPLQLPVDLTSSPASGSRPSIAPVGLDAMVIDGAAQVRQPIVQSLTQAEGVEQAPNGSCRAHGRPRTPVIATHGFTAVNAPAARTSSAVAHSPQDDTSPETIKVASKRPVGKMSVSVSPRGSNKRSKNETNGRVENTAMHSRFPHPGAIILDQ